MKGPADGPVSLPSARPERTEGVRTLLGNPRVAILKLALPMIVAMAVQTVYNLADAIWVSGLGSDALSAVGFFYPFFFMAMALSTGLGIGGGTAISRRIGAQDKEGADNVAIHTIVLMVGIAVMFSIPFFILAPWIFRGMGAGDVTDLTVSYSRVIFGFSIVIFFTNVSNAILRAEGDTKRAMYAIVFGSVMNILLDPIFIYESFRIGSVEIPLLNLGIAGAAWATVISITTSSILLFYWLFLKRDTYVDFNFRDFQFRWEILKDIGRVGLPASLTQLSMSINMVAMNMVIVPVGGTDGVAIFSTGWRVSTFAILPLMGIAAANTSVAGAAYGARRYDKLSESHRYSVKMGLIIEIVVSVLLFALAPFIMLAFTWSEGSEHLFDDLVMFTRITSLFYMSVAFGMMSGSAFQGIGKGFHSLMVTVLRTVVLTLMMSILLGIVLDLGLRGIWFGIVIGNITGSMLAYAWVRHYIKGLRSGRIEHS